MSYFVLQYLSCRYPIPDEYISVTRTIEEAKSDALSFIAAHPDLEFSNGFNLAVYEDGYFSHMSHLSYIPEVDAVREG